MTREEAIDALYRTDKLGVYSETHEAVNMAIRALEQERSRSAEITQYRHDCEKLMKENERLKKSLEQQSVLDKIRAEVDRAYEDYEYGYNKGLVLAAQIIDKHRTESEGKE